MAGLDQKLLNLFLKEVIHLFDVMKDQVYFFSKMLINILP